MSKKLVIIDYGVGNIRSLSNALEKIGCTPVLTRDHQDILSASHIILPGVGAFPYCVAKLREYGLDQCVITAVAKKIPTLGICVGMQMLFDYGDEHGGAAGLGLIPGRVVSLRERVSPGTRLPHIEWSQVEFLPQPATSIPFATLPESGDYYFVHSYACEPSEPHAFAYAQYEGVNVCAAVVRDSLCGVQFHPEKSGKLGLEFLKNFVDK